MNLRSCGASPEAAAIIGVVKRAVAEVFRCERTALIIVGRALAAENFRDSALYDADYRRRFRGGAA